MSRPLTASPDLDSGRLDAPRPATGRPLCDDLPAGTLTELCGPPGATAQTTFAAAAVRAAQTRGEPAAWVEIRPGAVFAPDLAELGIDLHALPFVRVSPARSPTPAAPVLRAAEILLRSGGFGLVVADLRPPTPRRSKRPPLAPAAAARLAALARRHRSRVLLLTDKDASAPSLGPVVALRLAPRRTRHAPGLFAVSSEIIRNKLGLPHALPAAFFRGPWGCF